MKKLFSTSLLILAGMLLLLGSCKEDELPVSGEGNVANNELPVRLAETDYNPNNTYYLLNDNESQDVYFDSGQRSFYVSRPLQFGMDDEHCFQLRFYSPRALKNVTFWARIDGYEEEFKFMSLEKIMPFQQLRVHIPFATKDLTAYTRSGKKIRIMANPYLTEENLTFTVECDDPYWTRLQSIRCKWYIAFGRYSDTQDSWKYKMKASHTREAVAIALNMAYMFSSERFKTALYEFGPLHSNNDKTEIDKTALLANTDLLESTGLEIDDFGGSTVLLRSVPADVEQGSAEDLLVELAAKLAKGSRDALNEKTEWVLHSISCRAAIKAGDHTSPQELMALAEKILSGEVPPFCPHGRPCVLKLTRKELEKQFGRIV